MKLTVLLISIVLLITGQLYSGDPWASYDKKKPDKCHVCGKPHGNHSPGCPIVPEPSNYGIIMVGGSLTYLLFCRRNKK